MRQITDEYRIDPFKSISTASIDQPILTDDQLAVHRKWEKITFLSLAHKFCATNTKFNLSSAKLSADEKSSFKNCL
jgi:biotin carboxylase